MILLVSLRLIENLYTKHLILSHLKLFLPMSARYTVMYIYRWYKLVRPSVRGDNPRALASGISPVQ